MTNEEAKVFLDNLKICIDEHPIVADWLVEIANRKTENSSEIPNNCEPQTDCGDFADRLAYERGVKHAWEVAQKVFNSTVTFYEAEDVAKQIDKDINVRSKDEPQTMIYPQVDGITPSVIEPQTDTEIAKAIVHKMIDDAVIAEDAYPDLRQKMHDAVDEYEPQNYCDDCLYTDTCDSKEFFYACTSKATISKMEQVETMSCQECKHFHENAVMYLDQCDFCFKDCKYEPKDEPQTEYERASEQREHDILYEPTYNPEDGSM